MGKDFKTAMSRREFARRAAFASAAISIAPGASMEAAPATSAPVPQLGPGAADLPATSQAEAEARLQSILGQFGSRFSEEQKAVLKRLCGETQHQLDSLREFSLENSDGPALYLKPFVEREKKPAVPSRSESVPQSRNPVTASKKP